MRCLSILLLSVIASAQNGLPTVKQCRLDFAAWNAEAAATAERNGIMAVQDLPFTELQSRQDEMAMCPVAEAREFGTSSTGPDYNAIGNIYLAALYTREHVFILKHGLLPKLIAEDSAIRAELKKAYSKPDVQEK